MPLRRHHRTIDLGKKLSSFMTAPPIHNTQTMDKLTNSELNRLILEERQPTNIKRTRSPLDEQEEAESSRESGSWSMKLQTRNSAHTPPASNLTESDLSESMSADGGSHHKPSSDSSDPSNDGNELIVVEEDLDQSSATEYIFGSFFNVVSACATHKKHGLRKTQLSRKWSAANSSRPVPGDAIKRKPDLALLDDLEARWDTIKAVCELTTPVHTCWYPCKDSRH
ncbi:hypothetical protein DEU56DRAFT_920580 [Suillus clintonianus]|uniref:uncharacterized protein n=1 Tax=Suillus clintonianus TaxID=1904413 RepID=UPI001B85CC27|nr:uncharacterized protein DEU56DRAFT_920580 [Suillus clintonianus]KAG2107315.1 hypothetical protein DEU56DRAFT_920580 [Suillus clintonianus]